MDYSVLMSVYYKEKPEFLRQSMESMFSQTVPTNDFVLICDGPLSEGLDQVIAEMQEKHKDILNVQRLEKNGGLGNALNFGLKFCKNELVARMDSDDISLPDRCKRELDVFEKHHELSIVGGAIREFEGMSNDNGPIRIAPETNDEIKVFAKKRNPFNHPCVMFKKTSVEAVGGYQDFYLLEDYYLWIRMLNQGFEGYNIQDVILYMRAGREMYRRRSGGKYINSQKELIRYMNSVDMINKYEKISMIVIRFTVSLMPNSFRKIIYKIMLRGSI